jgi:hypothetical protein
MLLSEPQPTENGWPRYHEDYRFMMSGAHRKPAPEIGTPSITWHAGFWKPQPPLPANTKEAELSWDHHDKWIFSIERFIFHIFTELNRHHEKHGGKWSAPSLFNLQPSQVIDKTGLRLLRRRFPLNWVDKNSMVGLEYFDIGSRPEKGEPYIGMSRYETVHIDAVWESIPIDIRFEVSGEYFTIASTIDFSRMREQPEIDLSRMRGHPEAAKRRRRKRDGEFDGESAIYRKVKFCLYHMIVQTNDRFQRVSTPHAKAEWKDPDIAALKLTRDESGDDIEIARFLYFDIWEVFKKFISEGKSGFNYGEQLGRCFADFRNLSLQCSERTGKIINPWKWQEELASQSHIVANSDAWIDCPLRKTIMGREFKNDDIEWVDAIHPILLALEPDEVNLTASDPVEYTFTKFCHDRCVYGSGFGPQIEPETGADQSTFKPLTYILLFGFDEHRQIGRLLHRLHTLGTLRQAALYDLRVFKNDYDFRLDDIEEKLRKIQRNISILFYRVYSHSDHKQDQLQKIQTVQVQQNNDPEIDEYEQNTEEIETKIKELLREVHDELGQLEGVKGATEWRGYIAQRAWRSRYYRDRFDILAAALNSSQIEGYQPYQVFIEHRLTRAYFIIRLVAEHYQQLRIKEVSLRKEWMSLKSESHQKEIADIQVVAESFFFLALVPYYVSHTIINATEGELKFAQWFAKLPLVAWFTNFVLGCSKIFGIYTIWKSWDVPLVREIVSDHFFIVVCCELLSIGLLVRLRHDTLTSLIRLVKRKIKERSDRVKRKTKTDSNRPSPVPSDSGKVA